MGDPMAGKSQFHWAQEELAIERFAPFSLRTCSGMLMTPVPARGQSDRRSCAFALIMQAEKTGTLGNGTMMR